MVEGENKMTTINNLPKGYKQMENAEVWVNVVVQKKQDEFGRIINYTKWQKLDKPVNLGSLKQPKNQEIIGFKVVDNSGIDIKSFFGGMFK